LKSDSRRRFFLRPQTENYLKRQGRFRHFFEPKRDDKLIAKIQQTVDEYWENIPTKQ
jgi:pyruvate ferredoxin oxidoreductase beta subunit